MSLPRHPHFCRVCNRDYTCKKPNCEDFVKPCKEHELRVIKKKPRGNPDVLFMKRAREFDRDAKVICKQRIIRRDKSICYLCGKFVLPQDLTLDHVVPLAHGGKHAESNIRVTHRVCNSRKGASVCR